jgi:LemA protein
MKKQALLFFGGLILIVVLMSGCGYNGMVKKDQSAKGAWAQVENQYQRRNDLINNLVNTVKGYAEFEQKTLTAVIEARAKATQITVKADDLSPEKIKQFQEAQGQLSSALGRLMMVSEQYPNLKANEQFMNLQSELTGTENRVAFARQGFNDAVQDYNTTIKTFPNVMMAGMFGFNEKGYFAAEAGANKAPTVKF